MLLVPASISICVVMLQLREQTQRPELSSPSVQFIYRAGRAGDLKQNKLKVVHKD